MELARRNTEGTYRCVAGFVAGNRPRDFPPPKIAQPGFHRFLRKCNLRRKRVVFHLLNIHPHTETRREETMPPSFLQDLAGGTVGGVIGMTVVYPLDTAKSRRVLLVGGDVDVAKNVLCSDASPMLKPETSPRITPASSSNWCVKTSRRASRW